jgi:hypothetical protein
VGFVFFFFLKGWIEEKNSKQKKKKQDPPSYPPQKLHHPPAPRGPLGHPKKTLSPQNKKRKLGMLDYIYIYLFIGT